MTDSGLQRRKNLLCYLFSARRGIFHVTGACIPVGNAGVGWIGDDKFPCSGTSVDSVEDERGHGLKIVDYEKRRSTTSKCGPSFFNPDNQLPVFVFKILHMDAPAGNGRGGLGLWGRVT